MDVVLLLLPPHNTADLQQWLLLQLSALGASQLPHIWRVKLRGTRQPTWHWQRWCQLATEWQTEL